MSLTVLTHGGGTGGESASIFVTGLSEADTVTATKVGKTVKGKWVQKPNPAYVVPEGYTQLEYIESTGTQYIDTKLVATYGLKVTGKFAFTSLPASYEFVIGAATYNNAAPQFGFGHASNGVWNLQVSNSAGTGSSPTANTEYEFELINSSGNQTLTVNGTKGASLTQTGALPAASLFLFGKNNGGLGVENCARMKLWPCKFTVEEEDVRGYIPAKRNSDGVVGLYDLVTNEFYTNAGTGTFIAGAEIPSDIGGHKIAPIKDYGMWTVAATDGEQTATQDVLVDAAIDFQIKLDYSA